MAARTDEPFDPAVVAPWQMGSGGRGALLLHGFAGTPPELRRLGERLAAAGWRCRGPLLAGHGTTAEELKQTRWTDWVESARYALACLRRECDRVAIAGQSAGGTIALHLAATEPDVAAVACLATPVWLAGWQPRLLPLLKHVVRWDRPSPGDIDLYRLSGIEELWSYGRRSTQSVHQLVKLLAQVRDELVAVRAPVLIIHGERDRVIDPRNAGEIERRLLSSAAVDRLMLPRSGHGVSVDIDRETVESHVVAWFDTYCPVPEAV
ncbi:MAG TPA: alpha/beta fold hydrolase [Candidatus Binatia bacterium]|nr:alpha/beta fold hydrolase [Candidatus Binatia bacterium]